MPQTELSIFHKTYCCFSRTSFFLWLLFSPVGEPRIGHLLVFISLSPHKSANQFSVSWNVTQIQKHSLLSPWDKNEYSFCVCIFHLQPHLVLCSGRTPGSVHGMPSMKPRSSTYKPRTLPAMLSLWPDQNESSSLLQLVSSSNYIW